MALVLHLGGIGKCVRLIWEWSVHDQESGNYKHGSFVVIESSKYLTWARSLGTSTRICSAHLERVMNAFRCNPMRCWRVIEVVPDHCLFLNMFSASLTS